MENSGKDSFVFYRSFYEALQQVPKKYRTAIYEACFTYVFESREVSLSGVPGALWTLIKPQLDASQRRYESSMKGAEFGKLGAKYGKKGGRPRKKTEDEKPPLRGINENPLNVNVNVNDNDNVNVNDNVYMANATEKPPSPPFSPPTLEEVQAYIHEAGLGVDANKFVDYYAARGWTLSRGQPMKDWKAQVRYWERNRKDDQTDDEVKVTIDDELDREIYGDKWS